MASLQYRSLTEPDSFRLILLQPASSHEQDLQCTLEYTTISYCDREIIDHYTALSYVWGDPSRQGLIYVDEAPVIITATLDAALRDLRDSRRILRIWADALCINQADLAERSSQVELMGQIYSTAHHTVIHLGSSKADETLLKAIPSNTSGSISKNASEGEIIQTAETTILKLPWFGRVWIFQELLLSHDPWVQCAGIRARWTQLCGILLRRNQANRSKELQVLSDMNSARSVHGQKLLRHLIARRGLGATDPRDMIYAHLGIAADVEALQKYVKVDYEATCAKVYTDTARYLLGDIDLETLLHLAGDTDAGHKVEGLPSWAPDWSLPSAGLLPIYKNNTVATKLFKRGEQHSVFIKGAPPVYASLGYEADSISSLSLPLPISETFDPVSRDEYHQAVNDLVALYSSGPGVWWSGDEYGQQRHINLKGREAQHDALRQILYKEWLFLMSEDIINMSLVPTDEDLHMHAEFLKGFEPWLEERRKQEIITVGGESDGVESLMYSYLLKGARGRENALTGRRLAITSSGRLGIVPKRAQKGDSIVFLAGSLSGYALRRFPVEGGQNREEEIKESIVSEN